MEWARHVCGRGREMGTVRGKGRLLRIAHEGLLDDILLVVHDEGKDAK